MLPSLFATLRSIAHETLPQFLLHPSVRFHFRLEAVFRGHPERQLERRPTSLQTFQPVFLTANELAARSWSIATSRREVSSVSS
jgi:hypothetical protein